jgi:hypothetical protein
VSITIAVVEVHRHAKVPKHSAHVETAERGNIPAFRVLAFKAQLIAKPGRRVPSFRE